MITPPSPRFQQLKQAKAIQPFRSAADFSAIFDSLELAQLCGDTPLSSSTIGSPASAAVPPSPSTAPGDPVIVTGTLVDPAAGDDGTGAANDATKPFATVAAALAAVRAIGSTKKTITLTAGVHHLGKTMVLGPADSGTTFVSSAGYGTFRLNFHRFDRFELDPRGHTQP